MHHLKLAELRGNTMHTIDLRESAEYTHNSAHHAHPHYELKHWKQETAHNAYQQQNKHVHQLQ